MADRGLQKAYLREKDTGEQLTCRFNPKEITQAKSAELKHTPSKGAKQSPKSEYIGNKPRTMTMELIFETRESTSGDVAKDVETLFKWTCPTAKSLSSNKPQPPVVVLHWGTTSYFESYVKQLSAKYTMFDPGGDPVRASVNVTLEEVHADQPKQNPTSGAIAGRRTHTVVEGDTLHSIAMAEYGDPKLWRGLADFNGVDDPLRVRPGTSVLLPTASEAAGLS